MLKEEKKIGNKRRFICSILVILISVLFSGNIFADLIIEEYFLDLKPENHVKSIYSNDKKDELKKEEVHYDDIENLIHLFNPEILNNWNNWENNKSAQDIYDNYQSAADKLYNSASSQDSDLQEAMLGAQGIAMQIQADKNASDSYTNFLTNYLIEKQLVLQTKIIDLNYQKSAYELIKANDALEEARNKESLATNALNAGSGTQIDLLNAKKAVADARSNQVLAESNQKTNKRNLLINCGKQANDSVYVAPVDFIVDANKVMSINLNDDYQHALSHNIQREIYRRKIDNARTEEVKNELKISYDASSEKIYNDLEKKYSDILDAIDTVNNRQISLNLANSNYTKANNEFAHGNISEKELRTASYEVKVANSNLVIANYDLKIAYETYNDAVKGYSDC
ncbi:MAG: TolC family protein [Lachnospiraceae bacterium]|nr:TolC family protein [Lachnospiraceae bacterium]